jgi:hypothetical protein
MHELKQQLRQARFFQSGKDRFEMDEDEDTKEDVVATPPVEEVKVSECRVKFTPGVIVKLQLDQPVKDVKHFKVIILLLEASRCCSSSSNRVFSFQNEVKRYADVEYIDVNENSYFAYFRCASNEIANQVLGLNKWPNMTILKGENNE